MTIESEAKQINDLIAVYNMEMEKFTKSGIKSSGARARKALAEIMKLSKANRKGITEKVNKDKDKEKTSGGCCATPGVAGGKRKSVKKRA